MWIDGVISFLQSTIWSDPIISRSTERSETKRRRRSESGWSGFDFVDSISSTHAVSLLSWTFGSAPVINALGDGVNRQTTDSQRETTLRSPNTAREQSARKKISIDSSGTNIVSNWHSLKYSTDTFFTRSRGAVRESPIMRKGDDRLGKNAKREEKRRSAGIQTMLIEQVEVENSRDRRGKEEKRAQPHAEVSSKECVKWRNQRLTWRADCRMKRKLVGNLRWQKKAVDTEKTGQMTALWSIAIVSWRESQLDGRKNRKIRFDSIFYALHSLSSWHCTALDEKWMLFHAFHRNTARSSGKIISSIRPTWSDNGESRETMLVGRSMETRQDTWDRRIQWIDLCYDYNLGEPCFPYSRSQDSTDRSRSGETASKGTHSIQYSEWDTEKVSTTRSAL